MIQGNGGRAETDTLHRHNSGAGEKALEETGKQAGHAELHGDCSAAHPGGNNCAKCVESGIRSCPEGLRRLRGDPGLSPPGRGRPAGAGQGAPGRVLPALRRCPVITASPVSGCSQVVLFASSLRGRTHGPSQAGAAPPPPAPPPFLPFSSLPRTPLPARPGPAPLLAGPALT